MLVTPARHSQHRVNRAVLALALVALIGSSVVGADEAGREFFEKQVRPVLAERCFECHSGKLAEPKGGLRVDSRAAMLKGGDTGPAIVPGKPDESLLVDAVNHGDLYQMPPKSKLPASEIAALARWVELGAPWPDDAPAASAADAGSGFDLARRKAEHWCWQPIARHELPAVRDQAWPRQPLDRFILAKLEARGLDAAPPAEARTLIRRLHFDLTGLPPTPEEVEAFVRAAEKDGPAAYEALVDRLLDSPHFGERWGRHWLDLVRYAESRGHEFDYNIPNAFEYRDYVIRAFNADVPYDQFVIEHLAGDLLPQPRLHPTKRWNESILGTGFWFLGEEVHSPVDIRKDECDRVDNMLDVFSKTFLGVTVACARCHDHKFDAISQADYYALAGYVQSASYRLTRFETWEQDRQLAAELAALDNEQRPKIARAAADAIRAQAGEIARKLAAERDALAIEAGVDEVELQEAQAIVDYAALQPGQWMTDGPTFGAGPVRAGQVLLSPDAGTTIEVATYGAGRRDHAWTDLGAAANSEGDAGRLAGWLRAGRTLKTPTWTLNSGKVHYLIQGAGHVYAAVDSHSLINGPLHAELGKETGGTSELPVRWITHDLSRYAGHRVHLEFSPKAGEDLTVLCVVEGEARPTAPTRRANVLLRGLSGEADCRKLIDATLDLLAEDRLADDEHPRDRAALANWLIEQARLAEEPPPELAECLERYRAAHKQITDRIQHDSRLCLAMWEGSPVHEHLLIRGNHKAVGPQVPRRGLEAMQGSGFRVQGSEEGETGDGGRGTGDRLEFARSLVAPANPLVSRVMVNRVWHHLLGRGIVPSTDNLGVLGQEPTHPELLDYLATQFMQDGWSLKRLVRSVVLSSTYCQESGVGGRESEKSGAGVSPAINNAAAIDPQNLLFHRQNIKRLEGEAIRDAILAVSGRLDPAMYGPSVPVHLTPFMQGRGRPSASGPLDGHGRRSIYVAVRRNFLPPMMLAFDTPIPFTTIGRRNVSNVPAQALILMNDPFVLEQARLWARRHLADENLKPDDRVRRMYLEAFSREPTDEETAAALGFLAQQAGEYGLSAEPTLRDERVWADLAHVLFNVKEFVFVR